MEDIMDILKKEGTCCISGKPLSTSQHLNMVQLDYEPEWEYPRAGNLLMENFPWRAIAFVHDDEMLPGEQLVRAGKVKFAVEFRDGRIIYHPIENLKPIRYGQE